MTALHAGYAETVITPPLGTPLAGLFHHREAVSVVDDLLAKALVLSDGTITVAMVVCDIISIPRVLADGARALIADRLGIPAMSVMITATHTHTGPLLDLGDEDAGWRLYEDRGGTHRNARPAVNDMVTAVLDPGYREWIAVRIADAVAIAFGRLELATIAIDSNTVDGACFNRRFHMKDGTVVFNPGFQNPDILEEAGPIDPEVVSFLVENSERKPIALWSTLSLHYVGTDSDDAISPDYYGYFARETQRVIGCPGILANGTSGNINNVDVRTRAPFSGSAKSRMVARAVAAAAISSLVTAERSSDVRLQSWNADVALDRYRLTARDLEIAKAVAEAKGSRTRSEDERYSFEIGQRLPAAIDFSWSCDLLRLAQLPDQSSADVQVFAIGDLAIVALPGEVFVEFGLELKDHSPFPSTVVVSMSAGHLGYLPTESACDLGGYETWRSRSNWTAPGSGERLRESAMVGLGALRSGGAS